MPLETTSGCTRFLNLIKNYTKKKLGRIVELSVTLWKIYEDFWEWLKSLTCTKLCNAQKRFFKFSKTFKRFIKFSKFIKYFCNSLKPFHMWNYLKVLKGFEASWTSSKLQNGFSNIPKSCFFVKLTKGW